MTLGVDLDEGRVVWVRCQVRASFVPNDLFPVVTGLGAQEGNGVADVGRGAFCGDVDAFDSEQVTQAFFEPFSVEAVLEAAGPLDAIDIDASQFVVALVCLD